MFPLIHTCPALVRVRAFLLIFSNAMFPRDIQCVDGVILLDFPNQQQQKIQIQHRQQMLIQLLVNLLFLKSCQWVNFHLLLIHRGY